MKIASSTDNIIAISDLRRKFGDIEQALPFVDHFILTKKGVPFAILSATPSIKKDLMKKTAGAFKGTMLENDAIWKDVLKKKSRKENISL
jgi:hypothetical protein